MESKLWLGLNGVMRELPGLRVNSLFRELVVSIVDVGCSRDLIMIFQSHERAQHRMVRIGQGSV